MGKRNTVDLTFGFAIGRRCMEEVSMVGPIKGNG